MSTNFHLAPPSKTVDGLFSAPIDIQSIKAVFKFDGAAKTATADATIEYTVAPAAGNPIFDLRQNITQAFLDGAVFPPAKLAHHTFGAEQFTDLRVIESVQAAGSKHSLRVLYTLSVPNSQLGGAYLPKLEWLPGTKLRFAFGLSDLNRARYAEAWLPANLIFDQYSIDLELQITGTAAAHSVITNGAVTNLGANHWRIVFPERFTALSPMLEVHSADALSHQSGAVSLPVSGKNVTIDAWKPAASGLDLAAQINAIKTLLAGNETAYGPYVHDNRFTAFFNGGGMEYEGGTTTETGALLHETFHSWFARGIKPASQADGWWDEGFTSFHDEGANDAIPFDFAKPPALLCTRDPWQRHTVGNAYEDGSRFFKGVAAMIGAGTLNDLMRQFYTANRGNPVTTQMIEEFLLSKSGNPGIVDAFHRFVYNLGDPSPAPDLWLKDDAGDPGADLWGGIFWDSPDLWVRREDDGGTEHQQPEFGQDNWFYARVRNKGAGGAKHFAVTFHPRGYAGTQFVYPGDFLPCVTAKADFDLATGDTRTVKAKWPKELIPPKGTHTCMLASVIARGDKAAAGRHVWEHNNLAQKNLVVIDVEPDNFAVLPIVVSNWKLGLDPLFDLELWKPESGKGIRASVLHGTKAFLNSRSGSLLSFKSDGEEAEFKRETLAPGRGGRMPVFANVLKAADNSAGRLTRFSDGFEAAFEEVSQARMTVNIPESTHNIVGLKLEVPAGAISARPVKLHFVQRNVRTRQIVGGVAVQLNIRKNR